MVFIFVPIYSILPYYFNSSKEQLLCCIDYVSK